MVDVFVEWELNAPLDEHGVRRMTHDGDRCRTLHRVKFQESLLDDAGRRLICHFRAPDAESVRMALRCFGAQIDMLWPGTVRDATDAATGNVVVECNLRHSEATESDGATDMIAAEAFERFGFSLVRAIVSRDGTRMICLYDAPDANSIMLARAQNESKTLSVWPCRRLV